MNTYQYDEQESSGSRFFAGMLCGLAMGAIAGMLLAPRRGAELRGQVADSVNRASRRAKDTYNRASGTVQDFAGRAADLAENLSERAGTMTAKLNQSMSSRPTPPVS